MMRTAAASFSAALLLAAPALAGGPRMEVGAVDENVAQATLDQAKAKLDLARLAGLGDAIRLAVTWARGVTAPDPGVVTALENAAAAASLVGTDVYIDAFPSGSSQTPLSAADQAQFVQWLSALARAVPDAHKWIVGNEPNLNRFWLPQFGPDGEDVAAPAYEALLASAYDALKAVSPQLEVLGGALSHAGADRPFTGRDTHSPSAFILDLGAAYRASGRERPIMDAFSFHPYMLHSNEPPTLTHPPPDTTITIADYPKLVSLLGQAFDGTVQAGSTLPIVYDEFGVESTLPPDKLPLYAGSELQSVFPVDQTTQAAYYTDALRLAFCQPNVRAFLLFSLFDEVNLAGWQSGLYYIDGTRKDSFDAVAAAARSSRRNVLTTCPGLQVKPKVTAVFFPFGRPKPVASRFPIVLTCDVDCRYYLRLEKLPAHSRVLAASGLATGQLPTRIFFPRTRLAPGSYRFTLSALASQNRGEAFTAASPPFTIAPTRRLLRNRVIPHGK